MRQSSITIALATICAAPFAHAADAERGGRLARSQCAACHIVAPGRDQEVAQAPPFETIARKYRGNVELLSAAIHGPHPKMNLSPTRRETLDLAAYISTLGK